VSLTEAGSLGGGSDEADGDGDYESEHSELSPLSCGMASSQSSPNPAPQLPGGSSHCRRHRLSFAGRAGGNGLLTAPALPTAVATSFLAAVRICRIAAGGSAAAQGAVAVGSIAVVASQLMVVTAA
jgi:hypothetical protein